MDNKRRIHVLLVEDDPDEALSLKMYLEGRPEVDFTTEWAPTVQSAIMRLERGGVDVVLLDYSLPDGTGVEVIERIKEAAPDVENIVYTGWSKEEIEQHAKEAGALDVIQKPADPARLSRRIQYAVAYRNLKKEKRVFEDLLTQMGELMSEVADGDHPRPPSHPNINIGP